MTKKEHIDIIRRFSFLPLDGRVSLEGADVEFSVLVDAPTGTHYLGRRIGVGSRHLIHRYTLKQRIYLGTTSMDSELALVMANVGKAAPGTLVYDPFAGTGSILLAASHFGALTLASDIDGRQLRGTAGPGSLLSNFEQYSLTGRFLDSLVFDILQHPWRASFCVDAIIADPPYGVRAGARKIARRPRASTAKAGPLPPRLTIGEGPLTLIEKDGHLTLIEKDGHLTLIEKDGQLTFNEKDGPLKLIEKDGPLTLIEKDGHLTLIEKDGHSKLIEKDELLTFNEKDGPVTLIEKDGPLKSIEKDELLTLNKKEGHLTFMEKDGPQTDTDKGSRKELAGLKASSGGRLGGEGSHRPSRYPSTVAYPMDELASDLHAFALRLLRPGGRLLYWYVHEESGEATSYGARAPRETVLAALPCTPGLCLLDVVLQRCRQFDRWLVVLQREPASTPCPA
jgi:tRNA G10  N-methylase Trm11